MKEIKMIMTDLDGTLLRNDKTVSELTIKTLKKLKKENILFGIATGRTLNAVSKLIHQWNIAEYVDVLVGFNGAHIIDESLNFNKLSHPLTGDSIKSIINKFEDLDVNFLIYEDDILWSKRIDEVSIALSQTNQLESRVYEADLLERPQAKMLIGCAPEFMDQVVLRASEFSLPSVHSVRSQKFLYEYMDERNSKSAGINQVAQMHGFTLDNVMAFGDEDNDLAMLKDCGIGVCMANGSENAKSMANLLTKSNEEDGVAFMIEKLLANHHLID